MSNVGAAMETAASAMVLGLGQMGAGIARNLDRRGRLVAAGDARPEAFGAAGLSGRVREVDPGTFPPEARVLVFAVPSNAEIEAALAGVAEGNGRIVVDLTTSDPARTRKLAADLATRGFAYVDAAMTGGAAGADAGNLTLMMGGAEADIAASAPHFDTFSSRRFHLGPVGAGQAMKLIHNLILHSSFMATCEGLQMARRAGLDLDLAVEVLNAGNARSFVTEVRFPRDILSGTMMARSHVGNLAKDLGLAVGLADELGAPAPYGAMTRRLLDAALGLGHGATDFSHLFPLFEELAADLEGGA